MVFDCIGAIVEALERQVGLPKAGLEVDSVIFLL